MYCQPIASYLKKKKSLWFLFNRSLLFLWYWRIFKFHVTYRMQANYQPWYSLDVQMRTIHWMYRCVQHLQMRTTSTVLFCFIYLHDRNVHLLQTLCVASKDGKIWCAVGSYHANSNHFWWCTPWAHAHITTWTLPYNLDCLIKNIQTVHSSKIGTTGRQICFAFGFCLHSMSDLWFCLHAKAQEKQHRLFSSYVKVSLSGRACSQT